MNQILYTGGKKRNNGMSDKNKIIIFFVIFIIIFAICLIAVGANLLGKVQSPDEGNNIGNTTPEVPEDSNMQVAFESQVGGVKIIATCDIDIKTITYWWDEEEATTLQVGDTKYDVVVPSKQGTHTLKVEIINADGYKETITQLVIGDAGPELSITTDGVSNYVIKATDDEEVKKIEITLNGETQEVEVNSKEFEYKVPIPQGDSLIQVTVENLNGITTTKKAKIANFGG